MKKSLLILLLAVLGLGGACAYQLQQATQLRQSIAAAERETAMAREDAARAAAELQRLKDQLANYKSATTQLEARNKELVAGSPGKSGDAAEIKPGESKQAGGFAGVMKKMFTDPEMRKMMRSQQAMGIQMMYGDLPKELGLAPDDARQVLDILADRQMALSTEGMKVMGGDESSPDLEETGKKIAASTSEFDQQLEAILGKDGTTKLKEYERTIGDRMQLQQYKQAFNATGAPLDDNQAKGLLEIMKDERLKQPASPFDPGSKDPGAAIKAMQSEDVFDQLMATQEAMGKRVLQRAPSVLSPDQMTQLEQIQKQQLEMQKMGMKMGREMMKGAATQKPVTPPAPVVEVQAK